MLTLFLLRYSKEEIEIYEMESSFVCEKENQDRGAITRFKLKKLIRFLCFLTKGKNFNLYLDLSSTEAV